MSSTPREENRVPGLVAKSDADNAAVVLEADPVTKRLKVTSTISSGSIGTSLIAAPLVGQTTSHASTPQQLNAGTPIVATNGVLVQALAANTGNVYIGGATVSASTGYELQPGQAVPFTVDSVSDLYVVATSASDAVCWNVL